MEGVFGCFGGRAGVRSVSWKECLETQKQKPVTRIQHKVKTDGADQKCL